MTRRRFLKLLGGGALATAAAGCAVDAALIEPGWIEVTRPTVPIPDLPPNWDGVRIAHLTDLHHGGMNDLDFVRKVVGLSNAERPDLIAHTGDFGGGLAEAALAEALAALTAPLGSFAVLGNHDHEWFARGVRKMLARAGIRLVENTHALLARGGQLLAVAGVGDLEMGVQDLPGALAGVPGAAGRLLLTHNPDYAEQMPARPRVDLMLAGHTHGGKINIPLLGSPILPIRHRQYASGLAAGPRCQVYVSRGLGTTNPPVRFRCRPELPIITLRRKDR
jgi:predicted MPP superfamily phosphohydrolase